MWVTCGGAPSEQQRYALPFVIASDQGGQRVLPDNVGRLAEGRGEVEAIISAANRLATVPDPWITVGVMPEAPLDAVQMDELHGKTVKRKKDKTDVVKVPKKLRKRLGTCGRAKKRARRGFIRLWP